MRNWNEYSNLRGQHSFLSASNYHWTGYDKEKLVTTWRNARAKQWGTEMHDFAYEAITKGRHQADQDTIGIYINDCIDNQMHPEVVLYYSRNAFVTTDAITFIEDENLLKIFDLKTGETPASFKQLYIYAAYFCLINDIDPYSINYELRIYQYNTFAVDVPKPDVISDLVDLIVEDDDIIETLRKEEGE